MYGTVCVNYTYRIDEGGDGLSDEGGDGDSSSDEVGDGVNSSWLSIADKKACPSWPLTSGPRGSSGNRV